ncbi:hypothetical protein HPP92_009071 [Vanilla planifolia]|uniref:O-fucosyltransferase family protein n=1 Tax=Vanilla planifolia TaxID=51239 RepID=A0A835RD51_VANPL|nr:hypothetical protein HPP92_009071 [Vanilla planifolia]
MTGSRTAAGAGIVGVNLPSESSKGGRRNWCSWRAVERAVYVGMLAVLRRRAWLLAAPLLYVSAMLLLSWDLDGVPERVGVAILRRPPPGSLYRSPQVFERLWPFMQADANHSKAMEVAWHVKACKRWKPFFRKKLSHAGLPPSNGFLIIEANGGLNQQRLSSSWSKLTPEVPMMRRGSLLALSKICDAVAVAGLLNATLVIPFFHLNSVWRDTSKFGDIFDEDHFIETLKGHVRVVRELPEDDMVAFSCCTYDGGQKEKQELDKARERGWRGKFHKPGKAINPEKNRRDGKCPLTPLEVGMMLRGMGFDNTTSVYVASGKIYNIEKYMAPLRQLYPLLETKYTLASQEELAPFQNYSSRMAALDYTVCAQSEVFVTTQGGNFPHFLMGHRRFLYGGHSKTIKPDKKRLVLSLDNPNIRWERFKHNMQEILHQSDLKGIGLRKKNASLYMYPMPDCMCPHSEA